MDDRELLELAAKASGIELLDFYGERYAARIIATNLLIGWNPLTDDGDALRLAVKLQISIHNWDKHATAEAGFDWCCDEPHGGDPCAATRRAITRAAAAIVQEMTDAQG